MSRRAAPSRAKRPSLRPIYEVLEMRRLFSGEYTLSISVAPTRIAEVAGNKATFVVARSDSSGTLTIAVVEDPASTVIPAVAAVSPASIPSGNGSSFNLVFPDGSATAQFTATVGSTVAGSGTDLVIYDVSWPAASYPYYIPPGTASATLTLDRQGPSTTNTPKDKDKQSTGVSDPSMTVGPVTVDKTTGNATSGTPSTTASKLLCDCGCYAPPVPQRNSNDPHPIVTADVALPVSTVGDPTQLKAALYIGGSTTPVTMTYYQATGLAAGGTYRFALEFDAKALASGYYSDTVTVTASYAGKPDVVVMTGGGLQVVNDADSDYGAGQRPSNLPQLSLSTGGASVVQSDYTYAFFPTESNGVYKADGRIYSVFEQAPSVYTMTEPDGVVYKFNPAGQLIEKDSGDGNVDTYTYTGTGDLRTFTDPYNRTTTYSYATFTSGSASHTLLSTVTDFANRVTTYGYTYLPIFGHWVLASVTEPAASGIGAGPTTLYTSDSINGQQTSITDPAGGITTVTYDSALRVGTITQSGGPDTGTLLDITTFVPADESGLANAFLGQGTLGNPAPAPPLSSNVHASVQQSYTTTGGTVSRPSELTYVNSDGEAIKVVDPLGLVTLYSLNQQGQVIQAQELAADGTTVLRTTGYSYDSQGDLTQVNYNDGKSESWSGYNSHAEPGTYTDADGNTTTYTYDTHGNLTLLQEPLGKTTSYTYNGLGQVATETDPGPGTNGPVTTSYAYYGASQHDALFTVTGPDGLSSSTYDSADDLLTSTDPMGRTTTYTYDNLGREATVEDPMLRVTTYTYNADGKVSAETVKSPATGATGNATTTFTYDPQGRLYTVVQTNAAGTGAGPTTTYGYDGYGNLASVTDPLGTQTTYAYDADDELIGETDSANVSATRATTAYTYDGLGRVQTATDPMGRVTTYGYDLHDRVTSVTQPNPSGSGAGLVTLSTYDGDGNLLTATDPNGYTTTYSYNALGQLTSTVQPAASGPGSGPTTQYGHDLLGNLTTVVDPLLNTTTYTYYTDGNLALVIRPAAAAGGAVTTTQFTYDLDGELYTATDPRGFKTTYVYDADGEVMNVIQPDPDGPGPLTSPVTTYTYNVAGGVATAINPDGFTTSYSYDALGRLTAVIRPMPSGPGNGPTTAYGYDLDGNLTSVADPMGLATSYTYDALGRRLTQVQVGSSANLTTSYGYDLDGELKTVTDPDGNTTAYTYDAEGRQVTSTVPISATSSATTTTVYDSDGNVTTVIDPDGNRTTYAYDQLDRVTTATDPAGDVTAYRYDADGHVVGETDGASRTTTYAYDDLGRLTSEQGHAAGSATATETLSYTYDPDGNILTAVDATSLGGSPAAATLAYSYDRLDRQTSETTSVAVGSLDLAGFTINRLYSAAGLLIGAGDSGAATTATVAYYRDDLGRIQTETDTAGSARVDYNYNPDGQVTVVARSLGGAQAVATTYAYDPFGRLAGQTDLSTNTGALSQTALTLDPDGRLAHKAVTFTYGGAASESLTYTYDRSGQLTDVAGADVAGPAAASYAYDPAGNRDAAGTIVSHGRVATDAAYSYTYNGDGELIRKTATSGGAYTVYAYDDFGRMVQATNYGASGALLSVEAEVYDAAGDRAAVLTTTGVTATAYDGSAPYADFDGTATLTVRYLDGDAVDAALGRIAASGAVAWYLRDDEGSVRELTANNGGLYEVLAYDAYGNIRVDTGAANGDRFKFAGGQYSSTTGLYQYGARYLLSSAGVWTQPDPIGFAGGDPNPVRYAGNDPTNVVDPSGLEGFFGAIASAADAILPTLEFVSPRANGVASVSSGILLGMGSAAASLMGMTDMGGTGLVKAGEMVTSGFSQAIYGETPDGASALPLPPSPDLGTEFSGPASFLLRNSIMSPGEADLFAPTLTNGAISLAVLGSMTPAAQRFLGHTPKPSRFESCSVPNSPRLQLRIRLGGQDPGEVTTGNGATTPRSAQKLAFQLTIEEQMSEFRLGGGNPLLGAGTRRPLNDATRLAQEYGGDPADWAKMGSSSSRPHGVQMPNGGNFEMHWYQNVKTSLSVECKTKITGH